MGKTLSATPFSRTVLLKMYAAWTFAYLFMYPIGAFIYDADWVIESIPNVLGRGFYYIYLIVIVAIFIFFISHNRCIISYKSTKNNQIIRPHIKRLNKGISCLSIFLMLGILITYYYLITESIDYSLLFNRNNRTEGVFITQQWVIYVYFIQSLLFVSIYYSEELGKSELVLFIVLTASFFVMEILFLGGRRYSVAIVLFYMYRKGHFEYLFGTKLGALLISIAVMGGIVFGVIRELLFHNIMLSDSDMNKNIYTAFTSNEFTEIGAGIARTVQLSMDLDNLKFGSTLLNIFLFFIPRSIFEDKPFSLTYQLEIPISIYSELFLNFHLAGLVIIILLVYIVGRVSIKGSSSYIGCVIAAYSFDFIRAEMATIFYTLFFVILFSLILRKTLVQRCTIM